MRRNSFIWIPIIFLFFANPLLGKVLEKEKLRTWQLESVVNNAIRISDYYAARDYLIELIKRKPEKIKYQVQLAFVYEKTRDYEKALSLFHEIYEKFPDRYAKAAFHLGKLYKVFGEYETSMEIFMQLKRKHDRINMRGVTKEMIIREMEGCELAISFRDTTVRTKIIHLNQSINKPHIEFSPLLINDTVFAYGTSFLDEVQFHEIHSDFQSSRKFKLAMKEGEYWQGGKEAALPFYNYPDYDTGRGVFSLDGNQFYFTKCNMNLKNKMICHLWYTQKVDHQWQPPVKLNRSINKPNFSASHPAIGTCYNKDFEVIYFVSDRSGGLGGYDIWYTIYDHKTGKHSAPENAGIYINSRGDEITPFYDLEAHQLYFSSNGWNSIGGYDIFKSAGDLVNWELPMNIGVPVNSSFDDTDFVKNESGHFGLFASNRPGSYYFEHQACCDDIYVYEETETERVLVTGRLLKEDFFRTQNYYRDEKKALSAKDSVEVLKEKVFAIKQVKRDSSSVYIKEMKTNGKGEFSFWVEPNFDYELVVMDSSLIDRKINFNSQQGLGIDKIDLSSISLKSIPDKAIVIENIYYDLNKTELTDAAKKSIDTTLLVLAQKYPHIIIEVRSHTDNIGHENYNKRLSERRAKNVVDYLKEQGISQIRMKYRGCGEELPIAPNFLEDGKDNPEGRQKNRRTEFKIIGTLNR
ncbi:MAG: OmpA family protein [Marinilabiliaceae bacterium]|nr:OmpA family protein [Marinilabiliaceae bacterium]